MNGSSKSADRPRKAWKTPVILAVLALASLACSKGLDPDLPNSPPRPKVHAQVQAGPVVTAQFHLPARPKPRRPLRT